MFKNEGADLAPPSAEELEALWTRLGVSGTWVTGLFTALLSGPEVVPPSRWLPAIIGNAHFANEADAKACMGVLMAHYNEVVAAVGRGLDTVCPAADDVEACTSFASGYLVAVRMQPRWMDDSEMDLPRLVMEALSGEMNEDEVHEHFSGPAAGELLPRLRTILRISVIEAYDRWHKPKAPVRAAAKVGRNDPCPCGSGKKHKKCCGAAA